MSDRQVTVASKKTREQKRKQSRGRVEAKARGTKHKAEEPGTNKID